MQSLQKIPIKYPFPGEIFPLGTLTIRIFVKPAHMIHIDYFPTLLDKELNLVSLSFNYTYTRNSDKDAFLTWRCYLKEFWHNDNIYKILRRYLYKVFDYWELEINLSIPYRTSELPSPFV